MRCNDNTPERGESDHVSCRCCVGQLGGHLHLLPLPSASARSSEHDELGGMPSVGCIAAVDSFAEPTCDFIGGASGQCDIPQTDLSARDFWQEFQAEHTDGEEDKWRQTVRGILPSRPETLADLTHLVDLLPDPRERAAMSERRWDALDLVLGLLSLRA